MVGVKGVGGGRVGGSASRGKGGGGQGVVGSMVEVIGVNGWWRSRGG